MEAVSEMILYSFLGGFALLTYSGIWRDICFCNITGLIYAHGQEAFTPARDASKHRLEYTCSLLNHYYLAFDRKNENLFADYYLSVDTIKI